MARLSSFLFENQCLKLGTQIFKKNQRNSLFIRVSDDQDNFGVAEYAPYMGIDHESIGDALKSIGTIKKDYLKHLLVLAQEKKFAELAGEEFFKHSTAASFLLSSALFDLAMRMQPPQKICINLSSLIVAMSTKDALLRAGQAQALGYQCLKIKIGQDIDEEIKKIKRIRALVGKDIKLRLDGNLGLSVTNAYKVIRGLQKSDIEYFEELAPDFFHEKSALDESFDPSLKTVAKDFPHACVVIKPSRFGSLFKLIALVKSLKESTTQVVFSTTFQSTFSAYFLSSLVAHLQLQSDYHGIFVPHIFKNSPLVESCLVRRGQLIFFKPVHIDFNSVHSLQQITVL